MDKSATCTYVWDDNVESIRILVPTCLIQQQLYGGSEYKVHRGTLSDFLTLECQMRKSQQVGRV